MHHQVLETAFIHKAHVDNDIAPLLRHKVAAMEQVSTQLLRFLEINALHIGHWVGPDALVLGTNNECCLVHGWFFNEWFKV